MRRPVHPLAARAVGLALGTALDRLVPDPQRHHPVAWFGSLASAMEERSYADSRRAGLVHLALCLVPLGLAGALVEHASRRHPVVRIASTAVACWAVVGGSSLAGEGERMAGLLDDGDLTAARARLGWLCGRLPDGLDETELARAALESVAENSADAVVAPLFWGAVCGVPGLLVHRGINTLDAMIGHHDERHENFGMPAARLDDAACWLPARITGALACGLAGPRRSLAWKVMRRDAQDHPSPNGGWCEAAFAGALGVRLGGRNVYPGGRIEHRGLLGDGPRPRAADLRAAAALARRVQLAATALATGSLVTGSLVALATGAPAPAAPGRGPRRQSQLVLRISSGHGAAQAGARPAGSAWEHSCATPAESMRGEAR